MKYRITLLALLGLLVLAGPQPGSAAAPPRIQTRHFRFTLSPETGECEAFDRSARVAWRVENKGTPLGHVTLNEGGKPQRFTLGRCEVDRGTNCFTAIFHPSPSEPDAALRVQFSTSEGSRTLRVSYEADPRLKIQNLSLLEDMLGVTAERGGALLVPVREGLLIPADSWLNYTHRFDTYAYEGCHMQMFGALQGGAAALVSWDDCYPALEIRSACTNGPVFAQQRVSPSLVLSKSAKSFQVEFLGKGNHVTIGKAYRELAKEKGLLVTWDEKLKGHPDRAKLFGAINYKLWSVLDRQMNEDSTKEESVKVNWTFAEAAQVAEHLKRDLKLDKVLFTMGGWIHRGYDNQHPDILPTAPECGGDQAFLDCSRRVMNLGYLLCLHDNYQDIYRDSPSWNERFIMKTPDGQIMRGGHWAGGVAYLTCSKMALELAKRPQDLPAVRELSKANSYFIDTTYAAGLQECFDPNHPLTRADDMHWKKELSDYARELFGVFGSECGREWAIPNSDFFEGLTGVSGTYYHDTKLIPKLGATVVPLFEIVFRDCIAMYGKYGYDIKQSAPYVLNHISIGRPLNYHEIPQHLYWKMTEAPTSPVGEAGLFTRGDNGWTAGLHPMDRFVKNTYEILSPLNELTANQKMTDHQFLTADRKVQQTVFGKGSDAVTVIVNGSGTNFVCATKAGGKVRLPPNGFVIDSPRFAAFYALLWNGHYYDSPALFTMRSLDDRPLARSEKVRIYHAFGSPEIQLGNTLHSIQAEQVVSAR